MRGRGRQILPHPPAPLLWLTPRPLRLAKLGWIHHPAALPTRAMGGVKRRRHGSSPGSRNPQRQSERIRSQPRRRVCPWDPEPTKALRRILMRSCSAPAASWPPPSPRPCTLGSPTPPLPRRATATSAPQNTALCTPKGTAMVRARMLPIDRRRILGHLSHVGLRRTFAPIRPLWRRLPVLPLPLPPLLPHFLGWT